MDKVEIFSDGSCLGNPGPGGWGSIIKTNGSEAELVGGKKQTTNNEMELSGIIEALKSLKNPSEVTVTTDSQYVVKGMTEWMKGWTRNGWKTVSKQPVKNREFWDELNRLSAIHKISWRWVRGHDGHAENERCNTLAQGAAFKAADKR
ncbi:MAG: ribonuclease HI [Nitrospinae bacterium]|nr:ribonuclease HI [Nitrospinota bacterium]